MFKMKWIAVALVLCLSVLMLVGCSKSTSTDNQTAAGSATVSTTGTAAAAKQAYPTKAVECIMAASAGGGTDLQIRAVAPFFSKKFGKELIPVAVPGGSGTIGMTQLADSSPDGYTIGVPYTGGVSIMPGYGQTTYTSDSFRYICQYSNSPIVLAVNAKGSIKNVDDLIAAGKNDTIFYSCAANGAIDLAIQAFAEKAGIEMLNVPVEGATPAITNVLGNQVQVAGVHPTNIYQYIESGDLIPILIFEAERYPTLPDTPTAKEIGVDMVVSIWNGLAVPADTPDDVYDTLVDGFAEIFANPEVAEAFDVIGSTVDYLSPDELLDKIASESAMFAELIASKT